MNNLFKAVGLLQGEVSPDCDLITLGDKSYDLFYKPGYKCAGIKKALASVLETSPTQTLIVYPKIIHFPGKERSHIIRFQVIGFKGDEAKGITAELQPGDFYLSGIWQFIPVCRTPCISVFKNFNDERLLYVKSSDVTRRVKFMKGTHAPLLWRDAIVPPFRFNPKLEKEQQGTTYFVSIKAKFLPGRDVFGFDSLLGMPTEDLPKFFKASKKMKAEAITSKKETTPEPLQQYLTKAITPPKLKVKS